MDGWGLPLKRTTKPRSYTDDDANRVAELCRDTTLTYEMVRERTGVSISVMPAICKAAGLPKRKTGKKPGSEVKKEPHYAQEIKMRIAALYNSGKSNSDIARDMAWTKSQVNRCLRVVKLDPAITLIDRNEQANERKETARRLRSESGANFAEIASAIGVTTQRAHQIAKDVPIEVPSAELWVPSKEARELIGVSQATLWSLCKDVATCRYKTIKYYSREDIECLVRERTNRFCYCGKQLTSQQVRYCSVKCCRKYRHLKDPCPGKRGKLGWTYAYEKRLEEKGIRTVDWGDMEEAMNASGLEKRNFFGLVRRGLVPRKACADRTLGLSQRWVYSLEHCRIIKTMRQPRKP